MASDQGRNAAAPEWEFLIAHHFPDRYSRTLSCRVGRRTLHLCARCSGELVGFVGCLAAFFAVPHIAGLLSTPQGGIFFAACPAYALADWLRQTIGLRESSNRVRVTTGGLLGIAVGGLVAFGVAQRWLYLLAGLAVLATYLSFAMLVLYRTGAWKRVLAEHFP